MNKNLPNVFAVPIEKKIKNNEDVFVSSVKEDRSLSISPQEVDKLFNAKEHVYKTRVKLVTKTNTEEVDIVGRTESALLTLDGRKIRLDDILEIKKV